MNSDNIDIEFLENNKSTGQQPDPVASDEDVLHLELPSEEEPPGSEVETEPDEESADLELLMSEESESDDDMVDEMDETISMSDSEDALTDIYA